MLHQAWLLTKKGLGVGRLFSISRASEALGELIRDQLRLGDGRAAAAVLQPGQGGLQENTFLVTQAQNTEERFSLHLPDNN